MHPPSPPLTLCRTCADNFPYTVSRELDATKPVVWGGDINVCASGRDVSDPEKGWNKLPGFTQQGEFRLSLASIVCASLVSLMP